MTVRYTLILIAFVMPLRFHTFTLSWPKAALAFVASGVHLVINDDRLGEGELFYHLQSLSLDSDVGLDVWFSRRLFCADGLAIVITGHWELVNTVLYAGFGTQMANRNSLKIISVIIFSLFAWILLRLKAAVSAVLNVDFNIWATKCWEGEERHFPV